MIHARSFLIAGLVALAASQCPASYGANTYLSAQTFQQLTIAEAPASTDCSTACTNNPLCARWTYVAGWAVPCNLLSFHAPFSQITTPGAESGCIRETAVADNDICDITNPVPTFFLNGPYIASFPSTDVTTKEDCQARCVANPSCGKWTYAIGRAVACFHKAIGEADNAETQDWAYSGCERETIPTASPTANPTMAPTMAPTLAPTMAPTNAPTMAPTMAPTDAPTPAPTTCPAPVCAVPTAFFPDCPASYPADTYLSGQNFRQLDIAAAPTVDSCRMACEDDSFCSRWSYMAGWATPCSLMTSHASFAQIATPGAQSGCVRAQPACGVDLCEDGRGIVHTVFLTGPYLATFQETEVSTAAQCAEKCEQDLACGKWSYAMGRPTSCYLKAVGEDDCAMTEDWTESACVRRTPAPTMMPTMQPTMAPTLATCDTPSPIADASCPTFYAAGEYLSAQYFKQIDLTTAPNSAVCQTECQNNPLCSRWTYYPGWAVPCSLLSSHSTFARINTGVAAVESGCVRVEPVAGTDICAFAPEMIPTFFLTGPYLETFDGMTSPSKEDCQARCDANPSCGKWSYAIGRATACYLKEAGLPDCADTGDWIYSACKA